MTQSETQERLKQIGDRNKCGDYDLDIDFLLSLIDSQAYEVNEVDAERLADYHKIGSMPAIVKSVDYGALTLAECVEMAIDRRYKRGRSDAATQMRDACVETIRALRPAATGAGTFKDAAITALSSLTLDQVKQK